MTYKQNEDGGWPEEPVECRIAAGIWADICDRKGFDLYDLDEDIQEEIFNAWVELVHTNLSQISIKAEEIAALKAENERLREALSGGRKEVDNA